MESRDAKLALARKKLRDHQVRKGNKDEFEANTEYGDHHTITETIPQGIVPFELPEDVNKNMHEALLPTLNNKELSQESDTKTTEILISNKRNLEIQVKELQDINSQLEYNNNVAVSHMEAIKQKNNSLEAELHALQDKYLIVSDKLSVYEAANEEYKSLNVTLAEKENNYLEQLEFAKTALTSKESENTSLYSKLASIQNELEATQLRLQQLNDGSVHFSTEDQLKTLADSNTSLLHKIADLEQQLQLAHKERNQINSNYEHYASELNEHLRHAAKKNGELMKEVQSLSARENSLIQQISEMEINMQSLRSFKDNAAYATSPVDMDLNHELQQKYDSLQEQFTKYQMQYNDILNKYQESQKKIEELEESKNSEYENDNISITKLNADITNDKVAAQRATEQNKKMKTDLYELEEAFVKMSKDKLELTEKLDAEKFLNRELTIKLSEIVEKAKDLEIKIKAKDHEMIRLQTSYREIETKFEQLSLSLHSQQEVVLLEENTEKVHNDTIIIDSIKDREVNTLETTLPETEICQHTHQHNTMFCKQHIESKNPDDFIKDNGAMIKLQDRFLKIMEEVADLSDEKHRLEHIIMQLQNETETICEYVALYQQQRSLLKQRDEERNIQIKIFQSECDKMKNQLNELGRLIAKIAEDKELTAYFEKESKLSDITNVLNIIGNMKNNFLVNPASNKQYAQMENFYPCSCCSGNLIDV